MDITCISDLHGYYPALDGGDLLIIAGDLNARDKKNEYDDFRTWIAKQNYKKIIVIAGNHDGLIENGMKRKTDDPLHPNHLVHPAHYLCDSGCEFEGLKIWGSPWTPKFYNWHFMKARGEDIKKMWDLIPQDIDILITHGPPFGVLDETVEGNFVGCEELKLALRRIQPKLHIFGHIHESYGKCHKVWEYPVTHGLSNEELVPNQTMFINASYVNEHYNPVNNPIRVIL